MERLGRSFRAGMFEAYLKDYLKSKNVDAVVMFSDKYANQILKGKKKFN
jgi:capsule polysaccharide modification protein KpsS